MSRTQSQGSNTDRSANLVKLPGSLLLHPPSGDRFVPQDVLTIPKPVVTMRSLPPSQQPYSILMGNPLSPASISNGNKLSLVDCRAVAAASTSVSAGCASTENNESAIANSSLDAQQMKQLSLNDNTRLLSSRLLAAISSPSSAYTVAPDHTGFRKPKNAVKNNNSTFISRTYVCENLAKRLREPDYSDNLTTFNFERSLSLLDMSSQAPQGRGEPLAKINFAKEWPLCHAINPYTASTQQLDLIVGMSSGDLVWLDLISQRYERINKTGNVSHSPISALSWLPNSESLVMAAHVDGAVVIYDIYAEDSAPSTPNYTAGENMSLSTSDVNDKRNCVKAVYHLSRRQIMSILFVTPSEAVIAGKAEYLTLFNLETEQTTDLLPTLFGGVKSMAQSPDGRFLAIAAEDDMIGIFDIAKGFEQTARLLGHKAYVKAVIFDHYQDYNEQQEGTYRLASVGEDRQLIVWDFAPRTLSNPKLPPNADVSSEIKRSASPHKFDGSPVLVHGRTPQFATKLVAPAARTYVRLSEGTNSQLSDVKFTSTSLVVASNDGKIWTWMRAKELPF